VVYVEKSSIENMSTTPKLNIVCAIKQDTDPAATIDTAVADTEFNLENQRGTWNKEIIKWWIKGVVDEIFAPRENFMKRVFNTSFTEWDIEIPLVLIQAESEEDADIVIEFGTRQDDPYFSGDNGKNVLAYAGYPDGPLKGYMKIFTHWVWDVKGGYNIVTVIIHELGHLLGRPHSSRRLWIDIMDPIINSRITELSDWDITGAIAEYGARVYASDTGHDRLEKANRHGKERLKLKVLSPIAGSS